MSPRQRWTGCWAREESARPARRRVRRGPAGVGEAPHPPTDPRRVDTVTVRDPRMRARPELALRQGREADVELPGDRCDGKSAGAGPGPESHVGMVRRSRPARLLRGSTPRAPAARRLRGRLRHPAASVTCCAGRDSRPPSPHGERKVAGIRQRPTGRDTSPAAMRRSSASGGVGSGGGRGSLGRAGSAVQAEGGGLGEGAAGGALEPEGRLAAGRQLAVVAHVARGDRS